jgi:hypothetical protein
MFFPTRDAQRRAGALQLGSFNEAWESRTQADERAVAVATVHTRQDIVLIYSMLVDCHRQSVTISRGVWALVVVGALILWRLS